MTPAQATIILVERAQRITQAIAPLNLSTQEIVEGLTVLRAQLVISASSMPDKQIYCGAMALADEAAFDMWIGIEAIKAQQGEKQ